MTMGAPLISTADSLGLEDKDRIDDFEKDTAHVLPRGLVKKCNIIPCNDNDDNLACMLEEEVSARSTALGKVSKSEACAEKRHFKKAEFRKLSKEQKDELVEMRKRHSNNKDCGNCEKNIRVEEAKTGKISTSSLTQSKLDKRTSKGKHDITNLSNAM